ncbi:hypothetical protein DL765_003305 [Monosporascus sp. GIB2]|nr:hypothetical protein DL765_003305 [Monosporascus sp. GIB2]
MQAETQGSLSTLSDHFASIPWCASILKLPGTVTFLPVSRIDPSQLPEDCCPSQDQLFKHTLASETAVPNCLGFYQDPTAAPGSEHCDLPFVLPSASLLFDIRSGVNGFNGTAHGGFIAAMMDEAMGTFLFQNDIANREAKAEGVIPSSAQDFKDVAYVTARINIAYRRPLPTPKTVVVTASLKRLDGRKAYIHVVVKGEAGEEYAVSDAMWVKIQRGSL